MDSERIRESARSVGATIDDETATRLAAFGQLLLKWNASINLGGQLTAEALADVHFLDAFAACRFVGPSERIVDVGSGGGLPALPLAVMRPTAEFHLYEPTGKKVAFLRTAIRELGLGRQVHIHAERVSLAGTRPEGFDVAMSRATFTPEVWASLGRKLVRRGGRVVVFGTSDLRLREEPAEEFTYAARRRLLVFQ